MTRKFPFINKNEDYVFSILNSISTMIFYVSVFYLMGSDTERRGLITSYEKSAECLKKDATQFNRSGAMNMLYDL